MHWVPRTAGDAVSASSESSTSESSPCSSNTSTPPAAPKPSVPRKRYVPTLPVCKFYNSYFKSGCVHQKKCSFRHLKQRAFSEYCRKLDLQKPLSTQEIRRLKEGQRYFRENRFKTARKIFGALCNKYPFHQEVNIWLARTHDKLFGHSDKMQNVGCAAYYYRRAISIDPNNAYYHGRYASSAYWLGKHKECRVHFKKSLSLKSDNSSVHRDYAHYLQHVEDHPDGAESHYLKCLELFENDSDCHYFYANLLAEQKRYEEAQHHFQKAIKYQYQRCGAGNLRFHLGFAILLRAMKKYPLSKEQFLICLSLNQMHCTALVEYGQMLCLEMGDYEEGLKLIRTSLNIEYHDDTKRLLDRIHEQYTAVIQRERERKLRYGDQRVAAGGQCAARALPKWPEERGHREDDDDEKSDLREDALKIAQRIRESEFERFMNLQNILTDDKVRAQHMEGFRMRNLNDILLLSKIDTTAYVRELDIKNLVHSTLIKKKIERFKKEMGAFHDWLIGLRMEETVELFENYGILTFEQFDHHIMTLSDLKWLFGAGHEKHAEVIWNDIQMNANYLYQCRMLRD